MPKKQLWVGYDNQSDELILHPQCPFDYCVNDTVTFPLNNTDSVLTTDQVSCVESVGRVTVWYYRHISL